MSLPRNSSSPSTRTGLPFTVPSSTSTTSFSRAGDFPALLAALHEEPRALARGKRDMVALAGRLVGIEASEDQLAELVDGISLEIGRDKLDQVVANGRLQVHQDLPFVLSSCRRCKMERLEIFIVTMAECICQQFFSSGKVFGGHPRQLCQTQGNGTDRHLVGYPHDRLGIPDGISEGCLRCDFELTLRMVGKQEVLGNSTP